MAFYRMSILLLGIVGSLAGVPDTIHLRWGVWPEVEAGEWDTHMQRFFTEKNFIFGVATAEYQISGATKLKDSQFAHWEPQTGMQPSGDAGCGWDLCFEDIALLKELGVRSYRFSVDWSAVEPEQDKFDPKALEHYRSFCEALIEAGIEPMVTLHHFVHPEWFERLGGFEKEKNIAYFVRFSECVFRVLAPYVSLWCTINEPGVYIMQGYLRGVYPPGKSIPILSDKDAKWVHIDKLNRHNVGLAGKVLRHMLQAHIAVYWKFHDLWKQLGYEANTKSLQVGFAHQYLKFESFHITGPLRLGEIIFSAVINSWCNFSILEFFKTGCFPHFGYNGTYGVAYCDPRAPRSFDYFGLNYYSTVFLDAWAGTPNYYDEDIRTDMPYGVYAEGFYQALKHVATLGKPIYVTENGVADQRDTIRQLWTQRYIAAMYCAMQEGVDVRGYYYWSLMDNFEWDMGYPLKFGLYEVGNIATAVTDPHNKVRTLRPGARWFQRLACAIKSSVQPQGIN